MPRKQYPSDHRRYFRVTEDILDDPKIAALDLADLGLYIKLLAVLNRQKSKDGIGRLDRFGACALARRERWAYARPAFDRLAAGGLVDVEYGDGTVVYQVRKWSEIQDSAPSELRSNSEQIPLKVPVPLPVPKKKETKKNGSAESFPDPYPSEARLSLVAWGKACPAGPFDSDQIDYAIETCKLWALDHNHRRPELFARTIQGGMRKGWLLDGFDPSKAKAQVNREWLDDMRAKSEAFAAAMPEETEEEHEQLRAIGVYS